MRTKQREVDKQGCGALRAAFNNHQQLIVAADMKAHNLIQVNGLLVTALLAVVVQFSGVHRMLLVPVMLQLAVSLAVIVFCLAVTRPKLGGRFEEGLNLPPGTWNLLFFASYDELEEEEYLSGMGEMLGDADRLYGGLLRESYHQAMVLRVKYKYLRYAHHVFAGGVAVTVLVTSVLVLK